MPAQMYTLRSHLQVVQGPPSTPIPSQEHGFHTASTLGFSSNPSPPPPRPLEHSTEAPLQASSLRHRHLTSLPAKPPEPQEATFTTVTQASELLAALRSDATHIELQSHIDLTAQNGQQTGSALLLISSNTKTIRVRCCALNACFVSYSAWPAFSQRYLETSILHYLAGYLC